MFRLVAMIIVVLAATLLGRPTVDARDCEVLPIPCTYEGVPFALTVVDAETNQPLAEVHGLAEWQNVGYHGRNGPLMVQDAVSGTDGVLRFTKWGPIHGYLSGLVIGFDPVVSLFKPGYEVVVEYNKLIVDETENALREFRILESNMRVLGVVTDEVTKSTAPDRHGVGRDESLPARDAGWRLRVDHACPNFRKRLRPFSKNLALF